MEWRWRHRATTVSPCQVRSQHRCAQVWVMRCKKQCNEQDHVAISIISCILCHSVGHEFPGCSSSFAPSIQSMNQYSRRWISLFSLTNARSSSLGPPQENCQRQYPSNWIGECMRFYVVKSESFKLRV